MSSRIGCLNPMFGRKHTEATKQKIREAKLAEKNPMWKGVEIRDARALHQWVARRNPKPEFCQSCGISAPMDLANISQEYKRDLNDWEWLCRRCHMQKDGRLCNLIHILRKGRDEKARRRASRLVA